MRKTNHKGLSILNSLNYGKVSGTTTSLEIAKKIHDTLVSIGYIFTNSYYTVEEIYKYNKKICIHIDTYEKKFNMDNLYRLRKEYNG